MIGCLVPQRWRPSLDQSLCECWLKPALFRLWHVVLGPNLLCFLLTFSPLCSLHLHICLHDCLHVSVCRGVVHFCVCRCGRHGDQILRRDVVYLSPQMSVLYVDHLKVGQGAEPSASELYQLLSLCSPSWTQTTNRFCPGQQNIYSHVVVCVCGGGGSSTVQVFMLGLCRQPRCFSLCVSKPTETRSFALFCLSPCSLFLAQLWCCWDPPHSSSLVCSSKVLLPGVFHKQMNAPLWFWVVQTEITFPLCSVRLLSERVLIWFLVELK